MILNVFTAEIANRSLAVQWLLSSTMTAEYLYDVSIEYNDVDNTINKVHLRDTYFALLPDFKINLLNKNSIVRVKVTDMTTGESLERTRNIGLYSKEHWLVRRTQIYKFRKHLRLVSGHKFIILKRRRWGPDCPDCRSGFEQSKGRITCVKCLGTGFLSGYFDPIQVYGKIMGQGLNVVKQEQGLNLKGSRSVVIYGVPKFADGDFIYNPIDDIIYNIDVNSTVESSEIPVFQTLSLEPLARKQGSEARAFMKNPFDLEEFNNA